MNSKQLKYAVELSKTLNFSQVAERLGISQPALSKQISNLEKELGVELFNRDKIPAELTAAGEHFFNEARELLYREEQLYRSMEEFRSGIQGRLVIGISPFRSLYLLPDVCKSIKSKYPGVKIVLKEEGSEQLRNKALDGEYDFAVVNLPVDESFLDVIPIEQDTLVLVVPNHMLQMINGFSGIDNSKIDFKDCGQLPFIVVGENQEMRQLFDKNCSVAGIRPHIAMEVVGLSTAWAMASSGIGATLLPLQFVQQAEFNNNVKFFIPKCETNVRQPAIIMRRGQYLSDYAKYAIKLLCGK